MNPFSNRETFERKGSFARVISKSSSLESRQLVYFNGK